MSDAIICPVCETANDPNAVNCEVCGERLAPAAPGEEIPPEQNMAASLKAEGASIPEELPQPQAGGFDMDDEHEEMLPEPQLDEVYPEGFMEPAPAPVDPEDEAMHIEQPEATALPGGEPETPDVLYSHMTGEAYPAGSPEYEEGFGPMGEQLHTTPAPMNEPSAYEPPADPELGAEGYGIDPVGEPVSFGDSGEYRDSVEDPEPPAPVEPPRESPFRVSGPNPAVTLPSPGTYEQPAELVLYFQKQPVLTYAIDTDEVLIGRKDIRADIDPDIDLTTWDHDAYVSRKHAYIYRQNKNYTLYAVSNGGLQLNNDLLELGDRRQLEDGDIIVIAGILAMKFNLPG